MHVLVLTKKRLLGLMALVCAVAALCLLATQGISYVAANASSRLIPIYSVQTEKKQVCLTFDAAWGNEDTKQLLEIFQKYNAKATFFIVGDWADRFPDDVKALAAAGHSIQNHSNTHPHTPRLSGDAISREIQDCNAKLEKLTGKTPIFFRAPYGDYDNATISTADTLNMKTIQWDIDSLDWKDLIAADITKRVLKNVKPGSIMLFHNGAKHTPEALPMIIEQLQKDGYTLVTLDEMIMADNYTMDANGVQKAAG